MNHFLILTLLRNRDNSRCMESRPPSNRRAKRRAAGQPPGRDGHAPRKRRIRNHEHSQVSFSLQKSLKFFERLESNPFPAIGIQTSKAQSIRRIYFGRKTSLAGHHTQSSLRRMPAVFASGRFTLRRSRRRRTQEWSMIRFSPLAATSLY
jgi:hypothetical protein